MRIVRSLRELELPEKHSNFIRLYFDKISALNYVDRIILFGSCAKGQVDENSDIDLFIVTKTGLADDSEEMYRLYYQSTEDIPLSDYICCDILTASKNDFEQEATPLIRSVRREGVELSGLL
jgi:predicted nucleotidyltransferase